MTSFATKPSTSNGLSQGTSQASHSPHGSRRGQLVQRVLPQVAPQVASQSKLPLPLKTLATTQVLPQVVPRVTSHTKRRLPLETLATRPKTQDTSPTVTVNTLDALGGLLKEIETIIPANPILDDTPCLYFDLEGISLGRNYDGAVRIVSVYVLPSHKTYLVDIHVLGRRAFNHKCKGSRTSLKSILESPGITKVFFSVTNDSDALFTHHGISVDGVQDLQVMEAASRAEDEEDSLNGREPISLAKCVEQDAGLPPSQLQRWLADKNAGTGFWGRRGRMLFLARPMSPEIVRYCAQDVTIMATLWKVYMHRAKVRWWMHIKEMTTRRILLSQAPQGNMKESGRRAPRKISVPVPRKLPAPSTESQSTATVSPRRISVPVPRKLPAPSTESQSTATVLPRRISVPVPRKLPAPSTKSRTSTASVSRSFETLFKKVLSRK